jgi:hypothetical protein
VLSLYYSNFTLFFLFFSIFQRTYLVIFWLNCCDITCDVSTIFLKPQIFLSATRLLRGAKVITYFILANFF